eukprot:Pgem_evm1s5854
MFDDIKTNAKFVARINDDTPPPTTTTTRPNHLQSTKQTLKQKQQYQCLFQLEWPVHHNKLSDATQVQDWQQNLENELTAAGIINIFKDETLNSDNPHAYKRCATTGLSLIKASINNKVLHELPNLHNIAPHYIINTTKDKLGQKKHAQICPSIKNNNENYKRRIQPERNNNGEQQHLRYHSHVVRNTLWMWTT